MTSSVAALKAAAPKTDIHVLVPARWAPVWTNNPHVARVWSWAPERWNSPRWGKTRELAGLVPQLRQEKWDATINFHASGTSALISRLAGARQRAHHFHGHRVKNRFSTLKVPGKGELKPILERDLDALRALKLPRLPKLPPPTALYVSPHEVKMATAYLAERELNGPLLTLGLGASRPTKIWPISYFAEVAERWIRETKGSVLALGAPNEKHLTEELRRLVPTRQLQTELNLPLRELFAVLAQSKVFVGNDSGPKHAAVALGVPTLTLFGPENPFEWHPYDLKQHPVIFREGLECRTEVSPNGKRWCGLHECTVEKHRCLRDISASEAYSVAQSLVSL
ncbi:MAG: glycosyltransferase family 9 protein [Bdellovibrionales bacterium]|nr:glycosyltransferase family 9 protein [Bdellovibrionales bacterium]